jgi:hypothetical protein
MTEQQSREMHAALVANGLNNDVANFLVAQAERNSALASAVQQLQEMCRAVIAIRSPHFERLAEQQLIIENLLRERNT